MQPPSGRLLKISSELKTWSTCLERRRKKQKVEFDEVVVKAAEERARGREQRALDKDLERKRLALEAALRGAAWRHPCVE